jgi:hypothetical protein
MLHSFAHQESSIVKVEMRTVETEADPDLELTVHVWKKELWKPEAPPSYSSSVKCSAMNLRTLESALLALLYRVDFQLAEQEFDRVIKGR